MSEQQQPHKMDVPKIMRAIVKLLPRGCRMTRELEPVVKDFFKSALEALLKADKGAAASAVAHFEKAAHSSTRGKARRDMHDLAEQGNAALFTWRRHQDKGEQDYLKAGAKDDFE